MTSWWRGWRWWPALVAAALASWPERDGSWSWLFGKHEVWNPGPWSLHIAGLVPIVVALLTFAWTNRERLRRAPPEP